MAIRVLVVDDSAFMRKRISEILSSDPEIEVIGQASDGEFALEKIEKFKPDVVTLDVEMSGMDGLTTLEKIMMNQPLPVVMLSALTKDGSFESLRSLELGAVDIVQKPSGTISLDIHTIGYTIIQAVKCAKQANLKQIKRIVPIPTKQISLPTVATIHQCHRVVVIGSSTGGPQVLHQILPKIHHGINSPIIIVQHMPKDFLINFSVRLNMESQLPIKMAEDGETLKNNQIYIAPGDIHLKISPQRTFQLTYDPYDSLHKPSIDVTMQSAAEIFGATALGVLLTGMGKDGALGMKSIEEKGGQTIAESEETAIIYGMPRAAIELGGVQHILPNQQIVSKLMDCVELLGSLR